MVYQRVSKPSSGNSQIHKQDSLSTTQTMPVPTQSVSASPQEQEMPSYTPLAANWATNNNLMRSLSGAQVVQRQEELGEEKMKPIQAKLTIGQVGDKYEQEADQTARRVVNQINAPAPQQSVQDQPLQREEIPEEELQMKSESGIIPREEMPDKEDEIHRKPESGIIQREEMPEEEFQMKPILPHQSDGGGMAATSELQEKANSLPTRGATKQKVSSSLLDGSISAKQEGLVLQRAYELNDKKDVTVTSDHRAKEVYVQNIKGEPLGPAANSPTVEPFGWKALWNEGHTLGSKSSTSSHYNAVRMHLWNGRLGGPGNETWNLAPGPAKVNSMMSAGPEIAAKNLVAAGYSVWLRTKVEYMNHSPNANDFTSVVPNKIVMEWGVMGDPSSNASWNCDIELPVVPLQGAAAQEYENWDQNKPDDLVTKLASEKEQVRAQAYDLVKHDTLKFAILKNYPGIYRNMEASAKGEVLKKFTDPNLLWDFLTKDLNISSPEALVIEALLPLVEASAPDRVQFLFGKFGSSEQRKMLIRYHDNLLPHLGLIGINWSKSDYLIFNYNSNTKKANLLDLMNLDEIQTLLGARSASERKSLFDVWAQERGYVNPTEKSDFIKSLATVPLAWQKDYETKMGLESKAIEYLKNRPSRHKKTDSSKLLGGVTKYRIKPKK